MTEEEIQKLGRKWFECLQEIKAMLTDPAWEGEELKKACRRHFMAQESFLRQIVGLAPREIKPTTENLPITQHLVVEPAVILTQEELVRRARKAQAKVNEILAKQKEGK